MRVPRQLLLAVACAASLAIAQQQPADMKDLQSVYVRDSGVASEKLALAERMERLREWDKSANVYQEIIEKYADRVIPTRSDAAGQVTQYTSVALVVQERLAKWQDEGLAVYRSRYEDTARDMLDKAQGDRDQLQRVMSQYFPTESAKVAGMRLVALSLERGEFSSAAWVGRRLLSYHPSLLVERPRVLFQTAIAEHLAGNKAGAQSRLDELKQKFPNAVAAVRGQEQNLVTVLEKELATQPSLVRTFRSDAWPVPFGNPEASAVPAQASYGGARMFSIDIPKAKPNRNANLRQFDVQIDQQRRLGGLTGIMPAVDNGELFFQDNARVYAINLVSGLPLPGWLQTHPGAKKGAYTIDAMPTPRGKPLGLCVTERSVVAILGQIDTWVANMTGLSGSQAQLVCLDRTTGKPTWSTTMQKLKLPDDQANLRDGQFSGMPLVIGDNVFAIVRANRGAQFEEVHLIALRLRDGSFLWSSYVASAASGNGMMDFDGDGSTSSANAMISYSDGRVYVQTNLGALACMDASDGKTLWLNIYPRTNDGRRNRMNRPFIAQQNQVSKPFTQNPPMIVDGRLFVAPPDSAFILVYDAASGEEIKRINRSLERPKHEPVDMLLAVVGDQMILGNRLAIYSIPWQSWDPAKSIMANEGKYKVFDYSGGGAKEEEAIRGRPFVSATDIFIPLASGLNRFSIKEWKTADVYPQKGEWDADEESPGNVLATPDHLVIAGHNRVTVYADLAVATRKLDEQLAADQTAVEPHLRYAELLLAGGKARDAIDWLDKSIDRMGGRDKLPHGPMRDRLFEITCGFAAKLHRTEAASPEVIRQLFERARLTADVPQQQVRYRMTHAAFLRKAGEPAAEIALHQQILAEPTWRAQSVAGRAGASTAAAEAEAAITELVTKDPSLYAAYETAAKEKLDATEKLVDAGAASFIAIADEWPLSNSTVPALRKAADLYEQDKQYRESNQTLRKLLKRSKDNTLKLQTLEALARSYALLPNQIDLAIVRLDQAQKMNPTRMLTRPIPLENGEKLENITLSDAVGVLKGYRAMVAGRALPKLGLPSGNAQPLPAAFLPPESLDGVAGIIKQQDNASRPERIVAMTTDSSVIQLDAGAITRLYEPVKVDDAPLGCAYNGDTLIVVTQQGASAIANGQQLWRVGLGALPGAEVAANDGAARVDAEAGAGDEDDAFLDARAVPGGVVRIHRANGRIRMINGLVPGMAGEEIAEGGPERISHFKVLSDRVVVGTTGGRVVSFDLTTGATNWQARPSDLPFRHFAAIDDFVVVATTDQASTTDLSVLDTITGQITSRASYEAMNGKQLINLALSRDGVLVTMLMNELSAFDLYETTLATTTWKRPVGNKSNGEVPFMLSGRPDQLVITDGRILAVSATTERSQSVRAFDLRNGEPKTSRDVRGGRQRDVETIFPSGAVAAQNQEPPAVYIRAVGPIFYIVGPKSLKAFHLDQGWTWEPDAKGMADRGVVRDFLVAQDTCVLLTQTVAVNANAPKISSIQFLAHSRWVMDNGTESGLLEHRPTLRDPAGILPMQWQIANGSFYYVSADQKLKMLKANAAKP